MARKTKDQEAKELEEKEAKKKEITKKSTATAKKATTAKKADTEKKQTTKKSSTEKKSTTKTATSTKKTSSKTSAKKSTTKSKKEEKLNHITEYYDLPYRYNQTIVKILSQTPTRLFVYWDISDTDREALKQTYGERLFEVTKPVLVVHNITLGYSFEIDIDDFANSWYVEINDPRCEYNIELGRRPLPIAYEQLNLDSEVDSNSSTKSKSTKSKKSKLEPIPQYIYISSSNKLEVPNNKVLYNPPMYETIYYRNVKTNEVSAKSIKDIPYINKIRNIGKFYNIYDLYKQLYKDEDLSNINNPSSGGTSSASYSSRFR